MERQDQRVRWSAHACTLLFEPFEEHHRGNPTRISEYSAVSGMKSNRQTGSGLLVHPRQVAGENDDLGCNFGAMALVRCGGGSPNSGC